MIKFAEFKTSGIVNKQKQRLNILHINKFHYLRGGSEMVYFGIANLMESHGHKSNFFSMHHPENLPCETSDYFMPYVDFAANSNGIMGQVKTAGRILYSLDAKKRISKLLDKHIIDIAHLHNIHHQISPSILHELKKRNIPVVMTLHDYKMSCASYSMLSKGRPCEACEGRRYLQIVKNKCVKDSFTKSFLGFFEMYFHHKFIDIYNNVDLFISPSKFLKDKLGEMGFDKKIVHIPNFIDMKKFGVNGNYDIDGNSIAYLGRLSSEKGLLTLLKAAKILNAKSRIYLNIIGDGPVRGELEKKVTSEGIDNVRFHGYVKGEKLYNELRKNMVVIIPSEWYENNPISVLEAFALEKPVVGARIGGIPELVMDGETGYTFEPGNAEDLSDKIMRTLSDDATRIKMGQNSRRFVESELNPEKHYQKLMGIYLSIISKRDIII